jgi:hypothetical protein
MQNTPANYISSVVVVTAAIAAFLFKIYNPIPWRDSISRPKAPSVAGGDDNTRPRRQGEIAKIVLGHSVNVYFGITLWLSYSRAP